MYENNYQNYQPETTPAPVPVQPNAASVQAYVDAAFGKALASAIMCEFPIASIIAIIFGCKALSMMETAKAVAASMGIKPSGKLIAVNILGKIGKIAGIIMTIFWGIYLIFLLALMSM